MAQPGEPPDQKKTTGETPSAPGSLGRPAENPERVYDHGDRVDGAASSATPEAWWARRREIAPAISPLIVGFTLLLVLISVLGYINVSRMDDVSFRVLYLEQQHSAKLGLLLKLRLGATKLNNEARAREIKEASGGLKPPFDIRLRTAREEIKELIRQLDKPPLSDDDKWRKFRDDLRSFVEITEDSRRYSLKGFEGFQVVDEQLDGFLADSSTEQTDIFRKIENIEQEAVRSIRNWIVIVLLVGAIVAAGTIWEVQRRFWQMRRSMFEASRERTFTTQLLEGMVSGVVAIDEHDRIRSANAAFFRVFPRATIGASVFERLGADDAMKMLEGAIASRATQASYRGRWVCRVGAESPNEKTFDVYSSPLALDGHRGQIVTMVDATDAANAERGLRRSESLAAVGQATAQVAHEIRNPLGSIRLGVSMLRDSVHDQEAFNTIELVERGIRHLNKLVVDVTQFSRQKALERSQVDLHELLKVSLDLVSESIKEKHTRVEQTLTSQKLTGLWDGHQLRQVFVNVISNAIDASPQGSPISISTEQVALDGVRGDDGQSARYARIAIADRGNGIDATKLDRIFEPFFSTKKRGTGLGLAIVKQIVEQHEGRISVDSEAGKGTQFIIDLPL